MKPPAPVTSALIQSGVDDRPRFDEAVRSRNKENQHAECMQAQNDSELIVQCDDGQSIRHFENIRNTEKDKQ